MTLTKPALVRTLTNYKWRTGISTLENIVAHNDYTTELVVYKIRNYTYTIQRLSLGVYQLCTYRDNKKLVTSIF